jgi:tRNA (adenine57-N1/adenine58-N1)-methyltransferase
VFCAYLPTTVQLQQLGLALEEAGFRDLETFETLMRTWHVAERTVRPDHRMVAHTGFVTIGRRGPVAQ